jgi:hypothetical protein
MDPSLDRRIHRLYAKAQDSAVNPWGVGKDVSKRQHRYYECTTIFSKIHLVF